MSQETSSEHGADKYFHIFSPTFTKRSNTVDKGIDYEHIYISNLLWKLNQEDMENYCISSHNESFFPFDDVIVETKEDYKSKKDVFAIKFQLVDRRRALKINNLTSESGDFNILKYVEQLKHLPEETNAILYTDATFSSSHGQKVVIDLNTSITFWQHSQHWLLINKDGLHQGYKIEIRKSDRTSTLFLYSGECNLKTLQANASQRFKDAFCTDDLSYNNFVNFIYNWSKIEGKKEKLSRNILERAAALFIVSPYIKSMSFSSEPVNDNTKLLRDTMFKLNLTIVDKEHCEKVQTLWRDAKSGLSVKKLNRISMRYQIMPHIEKIENLEGKDEEATKLLWLMGKCPLIVDGTKTVFRAYWLIQSSFVVINPQISVFHHRKFMTLADLKQYEADEYDNFVRNFKCLLHGKEVSFYDVIQKRDDVDNVTTNDLLQMVDHLTEMG